MNLVLLCHPATVGFGSMPRYARMIGEGMKKRGHTVTYWTAPQVFCRLSRRPGALQKWAGYLDSYLFFPFLLKIRKCRLPHPTLFVVTDQALGMWVPSVAASPHVIHCHDFLAQRSALGEIKEHSTGFSGRIYQKLIRRGYQKGRNFICISGKTRTDLARFLLRPAETLEVVPNGLNYPFTTLPPAEALARLKSRDQVRWADGYFLHVGGNDWYKNRTGVVKLYQQYLKKTQNALPLIMIGAAPSAELLELAGTTPKNGRVCFLSGLTDAEVHAAYAAATALIFPSYEEGFGWPIIEAQASGCPVLTTNLPPMSEVGGPAAWYLPRRPGQDPANDQIWAEKGSDLLIDLAALPLEKRKTLVAASIANASRFTTESALDRFEKIYATLLTADGTNPADQSKK